MSAPAGHLGQLRQHAVQLLQGTLITLLCFTEQEFVGVLASGAGCGALCHALLSLLDQPLDAFSLSGVLDADLTIGHTFPDKDKSFGHGLLLDAGHALLVASVKQSVAIAAHSASGYELTARTLAKQEACLGSALKEAVVGFDNVSKALGDCGHSVLLGVLLDLRLL